MLTDIFANRYAKTVLWTRYEERDRRFLVQAFGIINEQLFPGATTSSSEAAWKSIHDKLAIELGPEELSSKRTKYNYSQFYPMVTVCENFLCCKYDGTPADRFMKERLSFIELAFRERAVSLLAENVELDRQIDATLNPRGASGSWMRASVRFGRIRLPDKPADGLRALKGQKIDLFNNAVLELNARLQLAEYGLNYHNGFLQRSSDPVVATQVGAPFWSLVADSKWANVDTDMKEALDQRDSGGRDPAFYAARALESAIKIISGNLGLTNGKERGAHSFLDNLGSERGKNFIADWEREMLKEFFTKIRNPFGHGAGSEPMPSLTSQQTDWAIRFCMIWVSSLITRMP